MQATKFEFEKRFWIVAAIYFVGFCFFQFDISAIAAFRHLLAPILGRDIHPASFSRIVIACGALIVFTAATLRTWASAYLRTEIVHDTSQHSEMLVADGPFRYTRNPLYLANVPMAAGLGVLSSRAGWLFLVVASYLFVYRLIFREEKALRQSQGDTYLAYCSAVPRFWPALTPRVPSGHKSPQWAQAFAGETFIWLFGLAELTIALTLSATIGLIVFAAGFAAHFITIPLVRRYSRKT